MTAVLPPESLTLSPFAQKILETKYLHPGETEWADVAHRVATSVVGPYFPQHVARVEKAIAERKFIPGGRFLAQSGSRFPQTSNCFLLRAGDSREAWAEHMRKNVTALMTGGGVGSVYSDLRHSGTKVKGMGGVSTGPLALMEMVNEAGRHIMQGGNRRAAMWAGLHWWHPDVFDFIAMKDWPDDVKKRREEDFTYPARMDQTNISVILDDDFFEAYHDPEFERIIPVGDGGDTFVLTHGHAVKVYEQTVEHMLTTAEPGFSVDTGANVRENLRNPCCEITSEDSDDICCLGSLNFARITDKVEVAEMTEIGILLLLCGTLYGKVPYAEVEATRTKNRRLGLGVMGIAEWLISRDLPYAPNDELGEWMSIYADNADYFSAYYADLLGVSRPVKNRAIAPTGTLAILGETTSALEPLFAAAYKRRYLTLEGWKFQYVVDATAQRLVDKYGVDLDDIDTAYNLAKDPERRIAFQSWLQGFIDHAISSTLNLPRVEEQSFTPKEFGDMLIGYLPSLRGITAYPDGSRGGQPLNVVPYSEAWYQQGVEFAEDGSEQGCVTGVCGV